MSEWFVANTGSDSNDGATQATAFATLAKLKTVMLPGDRAYLGGHATAMYREKVTFEDLEDCRFIHIADANKWHITGDAKVPSIIVETDPTNRIYTCTVPAGLTLDYVCYNYNSDDCLDANGRRCAFIDLQVETLGEVATDAAADTPCFHYSGTTLTVGAGPSAVAGAEIEYVEHSDDSAFELLNCTNCLVHGIRACRTGMRSSSGGYCVKFTSCTDCSLQDFLFENPGYHALLSVGNINIRNVASDGIVHGSAPASTQFIAYCDGTNNPVQSPRAYRITFHTYIPLRLDGTQCTTVPKIISCTVGADPVFTTIGPHGLITGVQITISGFTGTTSSGTVDGTKTVTVLTATTFKLQSPPTTTSTGKATAVRVTLSIQAVYLHTNVAGAGNVVKDARFSYLTCYGYGQGQAWECNNPDTTIMDGTVDGRQQIIDNYPVVFSNCVAYEARNLPPVSCAFDRCSWSWTSKDYLGNSVANPSLTPILGFPIGFTAGSQHLYVGCVFSFDIPSGGSFPTLMGSNDSSGNKVSGETFINCTTTWNINRDYTVWRSESTNGKWTSYGSVWANMGTASGTNDFISIASGTTGSVDAQGNWYYTAGGGAIRYFNAAYAGETFSAALWTADVSAYAKWNIAPAFVSRITGQPTATNALATTHNYQRTKAVIGINGVAYAGNYGAWQTQDGSVARTLELIESGDDE